MTAARGGRTVDRMTWEQPNSYYRVPSVVDVAAAQAEAERARWRTWSTVLPILALVVAVVSPALLVPIPAALTVLAFVAVSKGGHSGMAFALRIVPCAIAALCVVWALNVLSNIGA